MSVTWNHEIRDGNMIYREGCCLSTDTKPMTDPTLGNGSKLLEMDTSKMWIYDADGCEWFGPDGALNGTIRFIRPKLIYNDEYVGIDFRLKLPAGKTPSDYPGSYVKFDGVFNIYLNWHSDGSAARQTDNWSITDFQDGVCHIKILTGFDVEACVYTPTFYYTENGTEKTIEGQGFSVENALEFEIARSIGRYTDELKAYADLCYYSLRYKNRNSQTRYPNSVLRYNVYNATGDNNRRLFYPYSDQFYALKDDDVPWISCRLDIRPKPSIEFALKLADGYTIQACLIDEVAKTVSVSGGVSSVYTDELSCKSEMARVFTLKINEVIRAKGSVIGYFQAMTDNSANDSNLTLQNFAYAILQYAKITHQI